MRFRVNGGATVYDFDGTTNLFGLGPSSGDPFDGLYAGSIAAEGVYRASETWAFFVQGFVDAQWEGGAAFDDSISGGGGLAVGYQIPDRFDLIVGVGLKSRLDRSGPRPYPLIDLEWTIDDSWRLRSHGQGLVLEYAINDAFKMFLRGRVETRRYRLDNHSPSAVGRDLYGTTHLGPRAVPRHAFRIHRGLAVARQARGKE